MSSTTTQMKINYKEYPECMFAMIAAFMEGDDGDDLRRVAGSVFFRSTDSNGCTYRNGLLHSYDDQPSNSMNDQKTWHKDGNLHREGDLPAVIEGDRQIWYKDGNLHRDGDLPAVINGYEKQWWKNGEQIKLKIK